MSESKRINWKKANFLKSKKGNLIVVNAPSITDDNDYFSGVIIYADESETNTALHHSYHFKKNKFDKMSKEEVLIKHK